MDAGNPSRYPDWATHYDEVLAADPAWVTVWEQGLVPVGELVDRLDAILRRRVIPEVYAIT